MNIATTTEKTKQENENKIIKAWLAPGSNNTQQLVDQLENNSQSDLRREDRASTVTDFTFFPEKVHRRTPCSRLQSEGEATP